MADNVDYNGLKYLIKERTTNIKTNPVTIPGQGPSSDAWTQLETELFPIIWQQHDRVSLFIRSKYGELKRRLDQVERQLKRLTQQLPAASRNAPPIQQTRKYAKLVQDTESISEDIQSLSQFANTQRLAFKKILKKYRRWTGSTNLQLRVHKEILSQPDSFLKPDLSPFLERLSIATSTLRSMAIPKHGDQHGNNSAKDGIPTTLQKSSAAQFHVAAMQKSPLKFDAAFLSIPLGQAAGRAAYWIHPDYISEAEVLLLRHMKHRDPKDQKSPSPQARTHTAIFDNLQRYVQDQGATTVAQIEEMEGSLASNVALSILWAEEADAVVVASDLSPIKTKANARRRTILVKRTDLPSCLPRNGSTYSTTGPEANRQLAQKGIIELREFMAEHRDVKPLAEIHSNRDRFAGLNNAADVGVWAMLDQDVTMSPPDVANLAAASKTSISGSYAIESSEGKAFPYAVLQFRWEFSRVPEIVRILDNSHLAERVRGFTLETEAIHSICSPQGMPKPLWQPLLGRDIRKLPPRKSKRLSRRGTDESSSPEEPLPPTSATSSNGDPSDSVFSTVFAQSSATSLMGSVLITTEPSSPESTKPAFGQAKSPKRKKRVRLPSPSQPEMVHRYWNEFDDGSEYGEDSSYAIYINPDEPSNLPGTEAISNFLSALYSRLSSSGSRILSWLPSPHRWSTGREREPLIADRRTGRYLEDSSDSDGNTRVTDKSHPRNSAIRAGSPLRSSSTLHQRNVRNSRETFIFRAYIAAFILSYIVLALSTILQSTGRHKASIEVDTGVILGVVVALFCGIGGVGLMVSRQDTLSRLHRAAVLLAFCVVCAGGGYLLALIGSTD